MKTLFVLSCISVCCGQTLEVAPAHVMIDETTTVRAHGLRPNERAEIQSELIDGAGERWSADADFTADGAGEVDTSKQAPAAGSYKEISGMGLVWSMMPESKKVSAYAPPKEMAPQSIQFRLIRDSKPVANGALEQIWMPTGLRRSDIKGTLHGVLFEPANEEPRGGVLVLGGSEGGAPLRMAVWLAGHGYAAFALAYFRYEGLPQRLEAIPLEYFGQALEWMSKRPEIANHHIGVVGTSRGGELALQVASMYPKVKAVVAYVPANTLHGACCGRTAVRYAWTWEGQPLPFVLHNERDGERALAAAIRVERTQGPILLISGESDDVWESTRMAEAVIWRLKESKFPFSYELLKYPHAGHRAGHSTITPTWHSTVRHPVSGQETRWGGTPEGDANSSLDAIPKVLDFLRKNLS